MDKNEVSRRVLQNGQPLDVDKFSWDEDTKTFSTTQSNLVIDFTAVPDCTFTTGSDCTFTTGSDCTFKTWSGCTFTTGSGCTFTTEFGCTFKTWFGCTFTTGSGCTFTTGSYCTFKTWFGCTFTTGSGCTFTTEFGCTWKIMSHSYPFPPLYFTGSRYWIGFAAPGIIRSGCIEKPIAWWRENIIRCAQEYKYTVAQQEEYQVYVELLIAWAEKFGWNEVECGHNLNQEEKNDG